MNECKRLRVPRRERSNNGILHGVYAPIDICGSIHEAAAMGAGELAKPLSGGG
jgi:hypothetical protein